MDSLRLLGFLGALICLLVACRATMYTVGDTAGWDISSNLDSWAMGKRFVVGDVLVFQYSSSSNGVCELTKQEYDGCDTSNAIVRSSSGNTTFPLTKPGDQYFASCNRLYCLGGMKLHVHVVSNSTASSKVRAPEAAPSPAAAGLLPRSSKSNQADHPVLSSSAEFVKVGSPLFLFSLGFFILVGGIV